MLGAWGEQFFRGLAEFSGRLAEFFRVYGPDMLRLSGWHLLLAFLTMLIACAIAIPLGVFLARLRLRRLSNAVLAVASIVQPIPSLALVALVGAVFLYMNLPTIGMGPGLVALVAYAVLPVLRNTFTGIRQVDPTVIEVARGMGMTRWQVLFRVELPLALPFIMAGVRIAMVWTIGVATLVSLIGAKSLGQLIFQGLAGNKIGLILGGALPAIALALGFDWGLSLLERLLKPKGLEESRAQQAAA
jgi:osmoprotectant transport system permease protein